MRLHDMHTPTLTHEARHDLCMTALKGCIIKGGGVYCAISSNISIFIQVSFLKISKN